MHASRLLGLALVLVLIAGLGSTAVRAEEDGSDRAVRPPKLVSIWIEVDGIESGAQAIQVAKAIRGVSGVKSFKWIRSRKEALVVREERGGPATDLTTAVSTLRLTSRIVPVVGVVLVFDKRPHCGGCVTKINNALKRAKGVKSHNVAEGWASVSVAYDKRHTTTPAIQKLLEGVGYSSKVAGG